MPAFASVTASLLVLTYSISSPTAAIQRGAGGLTDVVQQQRVAVWFGRGDPACAQRAAGAAHVLDDHLLAEVLGHRLGDQAGHGVGRSAGCERDDHGDRAVRVGLRRGGAGKQSDGDGREHSSTAYHVGP
jgi:hypothetical protein